MSQAMNKYHHILNRILTDGRRQENRKGGIIYLLNERLSLCRVTCSIYSRGTV